jgi:hypothetical protein
MGASSSVTVSSSRSSGWLTPSNLCNSVGAGDRSTERASTECAPPNQRGSTALIPDWYRDHTSPAGGLRAMSVFAQQRPSWHGVTSDRGHIEGHPKRAASVCGSIEGRTHRALRRTLRATIPRPRRQSSHVSAPGRIQTCDPRIRGTYGTLSARQDGATAALFVG